MLGLLSFRYKQKTQAERKIISLKPVPPSCERGKIAEKGYTLVPLKVYFKGSLVKVSIGLAKGKKLYDKRQDIAKKDMRREAEREFKVRNL